MELRCVVHIVGLRTYGYVQNAQARRCQFARGCGGEAIPALSVTTGWHRLLLVALPLKLLWKNVGLSKDLFLVEFQSTCNLNLGTNSHQGACARDLLCVSSLHKGPPDTSEYKANLNFDGAQKTPPP